MNHDPTSSELYDAVQGDYSELVGEIGDLIEFNQIVSQQLLHFGRQLIGTLLDRVPFSGSSISDVSSETIDCVHLVCCYSAEEGPSSTGSAYREFAFSCHDFGRSVICRGRSHALAQSLDPSKGASKGGRSRNDGRWDRRRISA